MDFEAVLNQVTQEFIADCGSTYAINDGSCEEWAYEVFSRLEKSGHKVEVWSTPFFFAATTHIFLRIDGKFYDAECLEGVSDHSDLPIFKKLILSGRGRQPVWLEHMNHGDSTESVRDISPALAKEIRAEQISSGVEPERALCLE